MTDDAPILEFDEDRNAIIEPSFLHDPIDGVPNGAVMTWMSDAFAEMMTAHESTVVHSFTTETADFEIHQVELDVGPVIAVLSHVGAPVSALLYECLVAIGCRTVVGVGSSGGLVREHPPGTIVVPDAIIRDEGVSFHYAPAARHAHPDPGIQTALRDGYAAEDLGTVTGDLWTTDALFRETSKRVADRVAEGAIAVDMEAAALATIGRFRGIRHGHAVYMADTLFGDEWDRTQFVHRDTAFRLRLLLTAARVAAQN
ncbi:MAG: nucleoside phosphorylase [Actinomycetota bacterium]